MVGRTFCSVLRKRGTSGNRQAECDRDGGVCEAGGPVEVGGGARKKTASSIDVRQTCHFFLPTISGGSLAMLCPRSGWRQSKDDANKKRENLFRLIFAKRNVTRISDALQQSFGRQQHKN
jgi:hypothetical protein